MQKEIKVMQKILNTNDTIAQQLRESLKERGITFVNMISGPGSGKTSLIEATAGKTDKKLFVIEGDIQTTLDAQRISAKGIGAYQINTGLFGGACHLEADWIRSAIEEAGIDDIDILFVENIGNLVCPAEFDIGAHHGVLLISVTEGEDKPLKYPLAFQVTQTCVITKTDLLPYLDIDIDALRRNIRQVNPDMKIIELSTKTGEGLNQWIELLDTLLP